MELRINGEIYTKEELSNMDTSKLNLIRADIEQNIIDINDQLKKAAGDYRAYGISADWNWFKKAETARRILSKGRIIISSILKERNKNSRPLSEYFVDVVKESISIDQFDEWIKEAQLRKEIQRDLSI
jgi:hypothetical protein